MFPTLLIGDHIYVDVGAFGRRDPERGEVVVFEVAQREGTTFPADLHPDLPRVSFVKRILGVPGDQIVIRGGAITLNGEALAARPLDLTCEDDIGRALEVLEESIVSRSWRIREDPWVGSPDPQPMTVPEGRYYLLGDNRDHSKDSRFFGTVAREDLPPPSSPRRPAAASGSSSRSPKLPSPRSASKTTGSIGRPKQPAPKSSFGPSKRRRKQSAGLGWVFPRCKPWGGNRTPPRRKARQSDLRWTPLRRSDSPTGPDSSIGSRSLESPAYGCV
jgi:signal peptidase I